MSDVCRKCGADREAWLRCAQVTCPGGEVFGRRGPWDEKPVRWVPVESEGEPVAGWKLLLGFLALGGLTVGVWWLAALGLGRVTGWW